MNPDCTTKIQFTSIYPNDPAAVFLMYRVSSCANMLSLMWNECQHLFFLFIDDDDDDDVFVILCNFHFHVIFSSAFFSIPNAIAIKWRQSTLHLINMFHLYNYQIGSFSTFFSGCLLVLVSRSVYIVSVCGKFPKKKFAKISWIFYILFTNENQTFLFYMIGLEGLEWRPFKCRLNDLTYWISPVRIDFPVEIEE